MGVRPRPPTPVACALLSMRGHEPIAFGVVLDDLGYHSAVSRVPSGVRE